MSELILGMVLVGTIALIVAVAFFGVLEYVRWRMQLRRTRQMIRAYNRTGRGPTEGEFHEALRRMLERTA